jgi:hypothetical protein
MKLGDLFLELMELFMKLGVSPTDAHIWRHWFHLSRRVAIVAICLRKRYAKLESGMNGDG